MNKAPRKEKEPYTWKCPVKGCRMTGRAATKEDARMALLLHRMMKGH